MLDNTPSESAKSPTPSEKIRKEQIMPMVTGRGPYGALLTPLVVGAVFYIFNSGDYRHPDAAFGWGIGGLIIGLFVTLPVWLIAAALKGKRITKEYAATARTKLVDFVGKEPEYIDTGFSLVGKEKYSGTGIAYSDGRIFILDSGLAAELPWSCIRSWTWSVAGLNKVFTVGRSDFATNLDVGIQNAQATGDQLRSSGFSITVQDINKPEWCFQTVDEAACKRWNEIVTQMNEGLLDKR